MVNLTIVSGFLGAGKTTLLRQLIVQSLSRQERCVVIENEFGSVGLDAALLARTGVPVHELNNGCVCCTLKASFAETLESILVDPLPDRIFFEPSGIFIPDSLLDIVRSPDFARTCRVASFVTVVDAKNFSNCRRKFGSFFRKQAEFADILALSKTESLDSAALDDLRSELLGVNPMAIQMLIARDGVSASNLDAMLDGNAGQDKLIVKESQPPSDAAASTTSRIRFRPVSPGGHGLEMFAGHFPASMGIADLTKILHELVGGRFGNIARAKGQLWADNCWIDFSIVTGTVEISVPRPVDSQEPQKVVNSFGEIAIIGEDLDKTALQELLRFLG